MCILLQIPYGGIDTMNEWTGSLFSKSAFFYFNIFNLVYSTDVVHFIAVSTLTKVVYLLLYFYI